MSAMTFRDDVAIDVRDLRMSYGDLEVLRGVDLSAATGEVVVLLGPNGAGKSTTIEILEGFRAPSAGHVRVLGVEPMAGGDAWRARLGIVLQSWRDHSRWRVRDLVRHLAGFYEPWSTPQHPRPWDADALLDRVGLGDKAQSRIGDLSGGQRRRLDVAVGLVGRPELMWITALVAYASMAVSGIFYPITALPDWLAALGKCLPTYWIGLGYRSALLPPEAAALEAGGSWQTGLTALVLTGWALVGLSVAPRASLRLARRQSGSQVAAARDRIMSRGY